MKQPSFPRDALLAWYDAHKRDLPWRATRDPYAIWVSEIMCQQTRVETVIPYWQRFMARFPNAKALADASEDDVLSHWSGLGYYRRARLLQAGAREVSERYSGKVPKDPALRRALPGIGPYTAGAIGSIAFDQEEAIVDGNVARVMSRYYRIDAPIGSGASNRALWAYAEAAVLGRRPGDFNQALMELGASVCSKASPSCGTCPLRDGCEALAHEETALLPVPKKKTKVQSRWLVAVVPTVRDRVWLTRSDKNLFGGLWGVPLSESSPKQKVLFESTTDPNGQTLAECTLRGVGIRARAPKRMGEVEHVLSHRKLHIEVWQAKAARGVEDESLKAFDEGSMAKVGIATLTRKILDACGWET